MRRVELLRAPLRRIGIEPVARHYYSPIPPPLPARHFDEPLPTPGVNFRMAEALETFTRLARHFAGFPQDIPLDNGSYEQVDAQVLFAMVREHPDARVVELGSGASTRIIHAAGPRKHVVFDPYPFSSSRLDAAVDVIPKPAEELTIEDLSLDAGDMLFVDTSHTVKAGGDVNHIILALLPMLAPGVLVHFHDVFLPYEYPRAWVEGGHLWAEQYLLQAFLAFNPGVEVVLPCHALMREHADVVVRHLPDAAGATPGAFWLRRV